MNCSVSLYARIDSQLAGMLAWVPLMGLLMGVVVLALSDVAGVNASSSSEKLTVQGLDVSPRFARPGQAITIVASVENSGDEPILDLQILPAVSGGTLAHVDWRIVDATHSRGSQPLPSGESVELSVTIRITETSKPALSAVIIADGKMTPPLRSVSVRVANWSTLAAEFGLLFVLLSSLLILLLVQWRGVGGPNIRHPAPYLLWPSAIALVSGLSIWRTAHWLVGFRLYTGLALLLGAWYLAIVSLTGAGRGRLFRGGGVAATAYVICTVVWIAADGIGADGLPLVAAMSSDRIISGWLWPFYLAQIVGIAGRQQGLT